MFETPEITDEMLAAMTPEQREPWLQYREQKKRADAYVADLVARRVYNEALNLTDSKHRAALLVGWDEQQPLTVKETRALLAQYWSITEAWSGDDRLREGMMRLIRRVAPFFVYGEDDDGHISALTPEPLTIYRGNLGETPGTGSWTLDIATAEKFATMANTLRGKFLGMYREGGIPSVWRAEVDAPKILGYFNDRDEREVVVDADTLRDVTLIRQAKP